MRPNGRGIGGHIAGMALCLPAIVWIAVGCVSHAPPAAVTRSRGPAAQSEQAVPAPERGRLTVERKTAPALTNTPVNFNNPPREYVTASVCGRTVLVERQLMDEEPDLARRSLARLEALLVKAFATLPPPTHARLGKLGLFLMYGEKAKNGGRDNGLEYFQKTAPRHHPQLDPRMASSVLIYSASNWDWLPEHRALMALVHELAHAHHLEQWPEMRPDIYDAWKNAKDAGLYRNVRDEDGKVLAQGYALQNHLEYFAELSMIYFVGGYYHPFDRQRLRDYDPSGYALIQKLWGATD